MIESEYVFNVAGTNSNGELLCSTLRHRLFGANKQRFMSMTRISWMTSRKCANLPAKTALFACFKVVSIDGDDARQNSNGTQNCGDDFHCV